MDEETATHSYLLQIQIVSISITQNFVLLFYILRIVVQKLPRYYRVLTRGTCKFKSRRL